MKRQLCKLLDLQLIVKFTPRNFVPRRSEGSKRSTLLITKYHCRLIHVLTLRKHFLTIDLKDTELFNVPDIWEKLGMANKAHKKLFLVLTDAKSPKFEKKERSL
jgi:hypothetical protein